MRRVTKRRGSTYLLVIVAFVFISLFSGLMLSNLSQTIFQLNTYGLQMQCYYLTRQAADATVAVLLDNNNQLLNSLNGSGGMTDLMTHTDGNGAVLGTSTITLTKEYHDYYNENKEWAVATIRTTIQDPRAPRAGQDFTYTGSVSILIDNPLIRLYNIDLDTL